MRLLVLGGTSFLGRHLTEHALALGHHVTLFNRGRTRPELFPGVPRLTGDRDGELSALAAGTWDAVYDFSGFTTDQVTATAGLLAPRIGQYVFMSSIAVYPRVARPGMTEEIADPGDEYGRGKADSERAAEAACPGRTTSIRAGLVIGPGDPWRAFPQWALAMAGDGTVRCGARPDQPLQFTDVRALAAFLLDVPPGVFNAVDAPVTFAEMLETCRVAGGGTARVDWVAEDRPGFIVQPRDGSEDGVFLLSNAAALAAGYTPRPLADSARDLIEWARRTNPTFGDPH